MPRMFAFTSIAMLVCAGVHAQVYVSTTGNNTTGDSWANAFTDVSSGVAAADSQNEDLWIAAGTYNIGATITLGANVRVYGGFPPTGNPTFINRDPGLFSSVLDANSSGPIFQASSVSGVVVDGVEFTEAAGGSGGAIRVVSGANIDIIECRFFNNAVTTFGAGVYVDGGAHADISFCEFDGNTAPEAGALMLFNGTANLLSCTFTNNDGGGQGGAILTYQVAINVNRCVFDMNHADRGGAIAIREGTGGSIHNSLFVNNTADDHGAGVNYESQSNFAVRNCTFVDNAAVTRGGGVFMNASSGFITNCIFVNNNQRVIYENDAASDPTVRNNMFFSNPDGVYFDEGTTSYADATALDIGVAEAAGDINNDPEFEDAPNGDYHLDEDSPARNAGFIPGAPGDDFDAEPRDASPDIGFDERDPGGLPISPAAGIVCALLIVALAYHGKRLRSA